jgi:Ca-activated chloride channel family protein
VRVRRAILLGGLWAPLALLPAPPAGAQAGLLVPTSTGRPDPSVLSLREMRIDAVIVRGYARVNIRQVFENHTGDMQEGTWRFRLPLSAAVGDFAVWDDLVRIPGVILEKQRARAIYRELTTRRIDPGLLQQGEEDDESGRGPSGGAVFSARVSPVPALGTKRLELQFQQEVPYLDRRGEFRLSLRPPDGEPPVAGRLQVRVRLVDAVPVADEEALPLAREDDELVFEGANVPLDRDLVVRFTPAGDEPAVRLSAFRNPRGVLPDGLALAPWERPADIPLEPDGFFLLERLPPSPTGEDRAREDAARPSVSLAAVFDTSLSHRWAGLERAYAHLVRVLDTLGPGDRFALLGFDETPRVLAPLAGATLEARTAALEALRARALAPGSNVVAALGEARRLVGESGRVLLLTDGPLGVGSADIAAALGPVPLFTSLTGEEVSEAWRTSSTALLSSAAPEAEADIFLRRVLAPIDDTPADAARDAPPFSVSGGAPELRDVYAVLAQPPTPGSLSGWVGRYSSPEPHLQWVVRSVLFPGGSAPLEAGLPEEALEARDLPRRWARARVDHLLRLIEAEGERREWVEEVIALSKQYRFVTPYTAFLAAPRSLLRPRRIQPGDPVLRVECDAGTVAATALLPFGRRLSLQRRPGTRLWEGRFMVPHGFGDGRHEVRILLRDVSGRVVTETKHFVLDGRAPTVRPELPRTVRPGERVRLAVRTDADVIVLTARVGDGPPVPLRWSPAARRSEGVVTIPTTLTGVTEVFFEAVDGAKNHGFARATLEVLP